MKLAGYCARWSAIFRHCFLVLFPGGTNEFPFKTLISVYTSAKHMVSILRISWPPSLSLTLHHTWYIFRDRILDPPCGICMFLLIHTSGQNFSYDCAGNCNLSNVLHLRRHLLTFSAGYFADGLTITFTATTTLTVLGALVTCTRELVAQAWMMTGSCSVDRDTAKLTGEIWCKG